MSLHSVVPEGSQIPPFDPTEIWLAERKKGIGGSDVASVLNAGYGCRRRLFYDKSGVSPDFGRPEAELSVLERGNELEDIIADKYARKTGRKVRRMSTRVSREFPWMRVNVDRQIVNDERGPGVFEAKSANGFVFRQIVHEGLPDDYILQVQHAMAVTDYEWAALGILEPASFEFISFEVARDEKLIDFITEKEQEFWEAVAKKAVPDALADIKDKRCQGCLWRKTCRGPEIAKANASFVKEAGPSYDLDDSPEIVELANDLKTALASLEQTVQIVDAIKEQLKAKIGERSGVEIPGAGLRVLYKEQAGARRFDTKALDGEIAMLRKANPEVAIRLENCRKQGMPTRPFRLYDITGVSL